MNTKKLVLAGAAGAVAVVLAIALRPAPVPVSAIIVERSGFQEFVEEEGRTVLRDPMVVAAPVSGYLLRVVLEAGDRVAAGDVLFKLESSPAPALDTRARQQADAAVGAAEARVVSAQAGVEAAGAEARFARLQFERFEQLAAQEVVAQAELDRARSEWERAASLDAAARTHLVAARFELANARAVLEVAAGGRDEASRVVPVRAVMDGVVLRRHRWSEGPVLAGEPVLDLGDLAQLEVQVDLLSAEAVRVAEGMRVVLTRWGGSGDLQARVRRVEPAGFMRISALGVEEQRVPVRIVFTGERESWASLGEGFRVEARFILWEGDDVLHLPSSALFRHHGEWSVFAVENGRATLRTVTPGRRSGILTQIISGLEPGATVITHPGDRVTPGTRVTAELEGR